MLATQESQDEFSSVLYEVARYYQQLGINVRAFDEDDDLSKVSAEILQSALEEMKLFAATLRELPPSKYSEVELLKRHLKRLGLRAVDDSVFDMIEEGDLVEIHSSKFLARYRSKKSIEYASYSLAKVLTVPVHELFYKGAEIMRDVAKIAMDIMEKPGKGIRDARHLAHNIWPLQLEDKRALKFDPKCMVPVVAVKNSECEHIMSVGKIYYEYTEVVPLSLKSSKFNNSLDLVDEQTKKKLEID